jgi:hypothetical protein
VPILRGLDLDQTQQPRSDSRSVRELSNVDVRGLSSSGSSILRGGTPRSMGSFPEIWSQLSLALSSYGIVAGIRLIEMQRSTSFKLPIHHQLCMGVVHRESPRNLESSILSLRMLSLWFDSKQSSPARLVGAQPFVSCRGSTIPSSDCHFKPSTRLSHFNATLEVLIFTLTS